MFIFVGFASALVCIASYAILMVATGFNLLVTKAEFVDFREKLGTTKPSRLVMLLSARGLFFPSYYLHKLNDAGFRRALFWVQSIMFLFLVAGSVTAIGLSA